LMVGLDERFAAFVKRSFDWAMKEYPILATYLGVHTYDDQLGDGSIPAIKRRLNEQKRALKELLRFKKNRLNSTQLAEYNALKCSLEKSIFFAEELRPFERDPDYVSGIADGVYPVFVRDFAPVHVRFKNIAARVRGTAKALRDGRENVNRPIKILCEVALEGMPRTAGFLKLVASESRRLVDSSLSDEVNAAVEDAVKEIQSYQEHVKLLLPRADVKFAMGPAKMRRLLRLRGLPFPVEEMLRLGNRILRLRHAELDQLASTIKPGAKWRVVGESLKSNSPTDFKQAWGDYESVIMNSRNFLREHQLASIPSTDSLKLEETPAFIRHLIPTAAYLPPAPFEDDQTGLFYITPVEEKTELLKEHTHHFVVTTVVHEAYPGHHLQLSWSNKDRSLAKHLFNDEAFVEGWAHYCEELMLEENSFENRPEVKFAFLQDAAWRAARVIVDIKLHTGKMSFEEAVQFLIDTTGMELERARREVKRYVGTPGQPLSYLVGKEIIKDLRKKAKRKFKSKYSDRLFHDRLMQAGMVTFHDLERILLAPI